MTRKEALQEAINLIQKSKIGKVRKAEILDRLELCKSELPFAKWTEEAVFDACDQFAKDHGHIRLVDFDHAGLPSHPTIKNRFGMTAKEFRDTYYPLPPQVAEPHYRPRDKEKWNRRFVDEFHILRCTSGQHYNRMRDRRLPVFQTLVRLNEVGSWTELLQKLKLQKYGLERPEIRVTISEVPQK